MAGYPGNRRSGSSVESPAGAQCRPGRAPLLRAGLEFVKHNEVAGLIAAPDLLTYVGEYDEALEALGVFAAVGGFAWRQVFELNTNLEPLRARPEFQQMLQDLRENAQRQLQELRKTERPEETCVGPT